MTKFTIEIGLCESIYVGLIINWYLDPQSTGSVQLWVLINNVHNRVSIQDNTGKISTFLTLGLQILEICSNVFNCDFLDPELDSWKLNLRTNESCLTMVEGNTNSRPLVSTGNNVVSELKKTHYYYYYYYYFTLLLPSITTNFWCTIHYMKIIWAHQIHFTGKIFISLTLHLSKRDVSSSRF